MLVSLNELGITLGFLLAFLVNYIFMSTQDGWRIMFGLSSGNNKGNRIRLIFLADLDLVNTDTLGWIIFGLHKTGWKLVLFFLSSFIFFFSGEEITLTSLWYILGQKLFIINLHLNIQLIWIINWESYLLRFCMILEFLNLNTIGHFFLIWRIWIPGDNFNIWTKKFIKIK